MNNAKVRIAILLLLGSLGVGMVVVTADHLTSSTALINVVGSLGSVIVFMVAIYLGKRWKRSGRTDV